MDWEIIDSLSVSSIKILAASTRMCKKSSPEPTGAGQRMALPMPEANPIQLIIAGFSYADRAHFNA
ncbi:hypothetical protein [Burkholderia oklahomensis]|uniref:hypothetical protein n=1 Tax=Burkholderia oklahomensis TaxID=342113 RepID=UPI0013923941|nr:hypothetical protein [Burkholderia oklahomensis]MBI0358822.1 hypothetical protein [Burkholderia oklahomensis]MDN7675959.1 hypothetical protein [Burkholderia oklahomensis]